MNNKDVFFYEECVSAMEVPHVSFPGCPLFFLRMNTKNKNIPFDF